MRVLIYTPVLRGIFYRMSYEAMYSLQPLEDEGQLDYLQLMGGDDGAHPFDNITRKANEARRAILDNGYDAMLMIETDVIVPPDALVRLAAVEADVVYGLMVHKHGWPTWNASIEMNEKMSVPISLFPDKARAAWGNVVEVVGVGSSCCLIHRHVLEELDFWRKDTPQFQRSCDWYFSEDCVKRGFVQKCDTTVLCGHIDTDLIPRVLWPDIEKPGFYRSDLTGEKPGPYQTNELTYAEDEMPTIKVRALQHFDMGDGVVMEGEFVYVTPSEARRLHGAGLGEMILTRYPERLVEEAVVETLAMADEEPPGWKPKPCKNCPDKKE